MKVGFKSASLDRSIASVRYRTEAPVTMLGSRGHDAEIFAPERSAFYDVIVFSKTYSADDRALAKAARQRGARVVLDLCDNHFYNPYDLPRYRRARDEILEMISLSDRVVCTTEALAAVVRHETGGAVAPVVVGDVAERLKPRRPPRPAGSALRLLWFGSHGSPNAPSGLSDVLTIREELEALAARTPVELTICSNSAEKYEELIAPLRVQTRYIEWSTDGFPRVLGRADAAILPLTVNPFTACKSHNRLTSALYAGLPTLATGIESYCEFGAYCTLDDWSGGFVALTENLQDERRRALTSRDQIDSAWSPEALAPVWEQALDLPSGSSASESKPRRTRASRDLSAFQGHLDMVEGRAVTGWVRDLHNPRRRLDVVLEHNGEVAGRARATLPRADLRAVGMPDANCGFSLVLPEGTVEGLGSIRILTHDWLIGERPFMATDPFSSGPVLDEVVSDHRPATGTPRPVPSAESLGEMPPPLTVRVPVEAAVEAQKALLQDIARVEILLEDFRRLATRSVVTFADSPELAGQLQAALRLNDPGADS